MSRTSPWPPPNYQEGDYRDDKKRRLPKGHTGELSSRLLLLDEDLEDMLASLTVDDIFDEGKSGDCRKDRKRKSNQDNAGDLVNRASDDLLENMFSSLLIKDSALASSASIRSGKHASVLVLDENILSVGNSDCTTSTDCSAPESRSLSSEEFIERVNNLLLCHEGTGVEVFEVRFDLNSTHAAHLDKWVQFASESGAQSVVLNLRKKGISCSEDIVISSRYNFPLHCFDGEQRSSIRKLRLVNCIFRPPLHCNGFSSLVRLFLKHVTVTDSDIQNICSCCTILRLLRLGNCNDLVNLRISHEILLYLDIFRCKKLVSIEMHATSLAFFEYDGHEVSINYASTPNMRQIVTKLGDINCSLPKDLNAMKLIKKVTLTFLSPSKEPRCILYLKKFSVLQFVNLFILPSWNNALAVTYLLKATPSLKRLRLEACSKQHHHLDNFGVSWPEGISLDKLRTVTVGGFTAQAPLIGLLAFLMRVATRLKYVQIDTHHHICKGMGKWVREDVGDKAARDHARNAAMATIALKVPPSAKLVIK
ncbi:uncharacterized protein LOC124700726 [Lolium rigidum]|uniref:uncharacterized protein LOC124700726 n=1 Tax=Lolium rigidum TaxID=89674 RepID=UPI001F5C1BBA|nr:uncharacterized protein LOC124700726 [Lolium rigidum]